MDRQMVYPGQIPLETDLLNTNKNAMLGLAKLAHAMLGDGPWLTPGLTCVPTSPASLQVNLNPGQIYSMQNVDGTAYSSLAADTTHTILKQGILMDALALSCPAPTSSGQSINYLIQVAYQDYDGNSVALPYYNASNPAQAYSGPNNSGTPQATVRQGKLIASVKAGTSATTGTQTTPAPDAGYIGAWVVTVAYGQTTITSGNISQYAAAPFLPSNGLVTGGLQESLCTTAVAGGTADAITAAFTPAITAVTHGMKLRVRAAFANATTTPTFTPNSGTVTAWNIVKGAGVPLAAGDIAGAGHWLDLEGDVTLGKWVLMNPATGVVGSTSKIQSVSASVATNALTAGYAGGILDFHNAALTNGAPIAGVSVGPLSIVVPSTATLGTVNGVAARLMLLVAYNAGSPVLCIANSSGGLQLDETNQISPTTISAAATSANVIYSASAVVANSPYRVVGFIDITEATAGAWATAPTLVQGVGGQALAAMASLGHGQSWQNLTASRAMGTTYYNTTGKPIMVSITSPSGSSEGVVLSVNGSVIAQNNAQIAGGVFYMGVALIIPPGNSYSAQGNLGTWFELR